MRRNVAQRLRRIQAILQGRQWRLATGRRALPRTHSGIDPRRHPCEHQVPMPRRILIVDDEPLVRRAVTRALRSEFEIHAAESCEEALKIIDSSAPFDAVVADLSLGPGPDGIELLRAVRQRDPICARLLLSAWAELEVVTNAVSGGIAQRSVSKPWEPGELNRAINAAISERDSSRAT